MSRVRSPSPAPLPLPIRHASVFPINNRRDLWLCIGKRRTRSHAAAVGSGMRRNQEIAGERSMASDVSAVAVRSLPAASTATAGSFGCVTDASADFDAFFRREFAAVLRTVELMLRDHARAEEIAQDAFVQLLVHWPKVARYERPDAWVRRVAIRLAVRTVRRDRLWLRIRTGLLPQPPDRPSRYDVDGAIRQLPGSQRAAIVLHYYEDRPSAEIAAILGCSESTARVHLHHGRTRLAQLLGEEDRGA
jgi:RNA polymerase sigma factor (sigma-70 family)